jgi:hypothetical protein
MRRLVSIPIAALMSLLIAGTAFASFCGNDSKLDDAGQKAVIWVAFDPAAPTAPPTITILEGANASGKLKGAFVDVFLDFNGDGTSDCFIDDTFILSEHEIGHLASGQILDGLAVNPAVHRGNNPGGPDAGVGFAATEGCG